MVRRIYQQPETVAIRDLKTYTKRNRREEVTPQLVKELNESTEEQALWYIKNLHEKSKIIYATGKHQMDLKGVITTMDTNEKINVTTLLDSGCTGSCISKDFVEKNRINTVEIARPIRVYNADGTRNESGSITRVARVKLTIGPHTEIIELGVSSLGKTDIFLGHDWLKEHNPKINWETNELELTRCPPTCFSTILKRDDEEIEEGDRILAIHIGEEELQQEEAYIRAKANFATEIAEANQVKRSLEEIIPEYCMKY